MVDINDLLVAGKKSLVAVHSTDNSENTSKRRYDQMLREKQREDEIKRHKTTHDVNQREDERRKNEHAVSTKQRPDTRRQHHEMVPNINHDDSPRTYKGRVLNTNYRNTGSRFESTGTKIKHTHTDRRHDSSDIDSRRWHEVKHNENPYLDSMRGYKENYGDNRHGNAQANYDSTNTKRIHEGDTVYRMGDRDHRRQYEYDRTSYTDRESNRRHESTRVRTGLRENKERLGNSQPDAANNCKETQTDTIPTTRFMCKCANSAYPVHLGLLKAWFILLSLQAMYLL